MQRYRTIVARAKLLCSTRTRQQCTTRDNLLPWSSFNALFFSCLLRASADGHLPYAASANSQKSHHTWGPILRHVRKSVTRASIRLGHESRVRDQAVRQDRCQEITSNARLAKNTRFQLICCCRVGVTGYRQCSCRTTHSTCNYRIASSDALPPTVWARTRWSQCVRSYGGAMNSTIITTVGSQRNCAGTEGCGWNSELNAQCLLLLTFHPVGQFRRVSEFRYKYNDLHAGSIMVKYPSACLLVVCDIAPRSLQMANLRTNKTFHGTWLIAAPAWNNYVASGVFVSMQWSYVSIVAQWTDKLRGVSFAVLLYTHISARSSTFHMRWLPGARIKNQSDMSVSATVTTPFMRWSLITGYHRCVVRSKFKTVIVTYHRTRAISWAAMSLTQYTRNWSQYGKAGKHFK